MKSKTAALLRFLDSSPSPFHAVDECRKLLEAAGFKKLTETASTWNLQQNGKYFFTRNGSSLVAFAIGGKFEAGQSSGVNIVAAHTDSPCLRIKPISKRKIKDGFLQVAVETYGGGLWHTWFDRDLGVAGRIITASAASHDTVLTERLVLIDRPIMRIPTLAIHLDRTIGSEGFKFNTELQLNPILASEHMISKKGDITTESSSPNIMHSALQDAIKEVVKMEQGNILALDLCLFDVQKAALGGLEKEFVQSARLDNLFMSFSSLTSLIDSCDTLEKDHNIRMTVLYDNEECGSLSSSGAESTLVSSSIQRILAAFGKSDEFSALLSRSFLLSADMAHAAHPNYSDKHDECHRPAMHKGIVIKYNSNQRYATNSSSAAYIKHLAKRNEIPYQEFMVRNDSPCGTTIGPMVSAQLGLKAVDVGVAQLSMHSIREMAGTEDLENSTNLFEAFFKDSTRIASAKTLDME